MGNGHALLSASASERWINCPPSARLTEHYPDESSSFAEEGSQAHALGEFKLKSALGLKAQDPTPGLKFYCPEMEDCATGYATFVLEEVEKLRQTCPDLKVLIEQRLDYSRWVPEGFGTGDCVIIADRVLIVIDYKHGQGVAVSAVDNTQRRNYALAAVDTFDGIYDIEQIVMIIYQPRRDNISRDEITKDELLEWAETVLRPAAELAYAGEGEYRSGEWCRFCKAKATCRQRAETNLNLAALDFQSPALLEDCEIETVLGQVDDLVAWANDIKDYALQAALSGKKWAGWKLVEGRSNRRYTDETAVAETVTAAGFDPYEQKLLGITALEKTLGKPKFTELLGHLVDKPTGKPALVPASDKRVAINPAADDFAAPIQ